MADVTDRLSRLSQDLPAMVAFFSRLPVAPRASPPDFRVSAWAWPLAGLLILLGPAALLAMLRAAGVPPLAAAALALAAAAAIIGALHEDGLADTADGFGGGRDRAGKLAIMRDSRLGTYGALALFFTAIVRVACLAVLVVDPGRGALILLMVAVISRSLALWHWTALAPARADGLAAEGGQPDRLSLAIGLATGALAAIPLLIMAFGATLFALALAILGGLAFNALCRRQIGGHTGDTVGAAQQVAETLLLIGLSTGWAAALTF
jgi:adenosylcobinamide-GDP ribazoletransferase